MRMWLAKEKKYARFSLKTRNRHTAVDKAKKYYHELMAQQLAGKTYFSMTTKQGVEAYLVQRIKDMEASLIVKGRLGTVKTHLEHWLNFIGRDNKLKELERTDCENYYHSITKQNKRSPISRTTVLNEQSTVNAMIAWLNKRSETYNPGAMLFLLSNTHYEHNWLPKIGRVDAATPYANSEYKSVKQDFCQGWLGPGAGLRPESEPSRRAAAGHPDPGVAGAKSYRRWQATMRPGAVSRNAGGSTLQRTSA